MNRFAGSETGANSERLLKGMQGDLVLIKNL
jgi:hypothetical protein